MTTDIESPPSEKRSSAEVPWESVACLHGHPASNLRASLKGMATMCRENATAHGEAAKKHTLRNNILQLASILITSSATITAAVSISDSSWAGQLIVAILSASSSATQAIIALLNPDGRKEKHLASEHRYTCLARDIVVKLVSGSDEPDYWEDVLKDCQRAIDNIQAIEPDL